MASTDYLSGVANPATNYLNDPFSFRTDMLDAGEGVIGAVFAEDSNAFGLVPVYGAESVAGGATPAVQSAKVVMEAARRNSMQLKQSAQQMPQAAPRLLAAAGQQEKKAGAIQQALQQSWMRRQSLLQGVGADTTAAVEGAGELAFQVQSPAGIGRLTRIPFLVNAAVAAVPLSIVGQQQVVVAAGTVTPQTIQLQTPQLPWAIFRLVAIEIQVTIDAPGAGAPDIYHVLNLSTGNGASLFAAAGNQPVSFYLQGLELRGGLRDYPIVRAPNFLQIQVSVQNALTGVAPTTAGTTIVSVECVCDTLADDEFGAHLPGPYARPEALIRQPVGRI